MSDVVIDAARFLGNEVELQGIFFGKVGNLGYLVDTLDDQDERANALRIDIPEVCDMLMKTVPPLGGSQYCYAETARIAGRLLTCDEGDEFRYRIADVRKFIVYTPDETYDVPV